MALLADPVLSSSSSSSSSTYVRADLVSFLSFLPSFLPPLKKLFLSFAPDFIGLQRPDRWEKELVVDKTTQHLGLPWTIGEEPFT